MILMTKMMTRMILMTKMMTWRKYDTALSSAAAAGAELNGHLLTWAFLPHCERGDDDDDDDGDDVDDF